MPYFWMSITNIRTVKLSQLMKNGRYCMFSERDKTSVKCFGGRETGWKSKNCTCMFGFAWMMNYLGLEHFLTCYALRKDLCEVLEHLEDL